MTFLYRATIFLSAFLLFQVQLILGKYLLPWFGGAPSVLTTCMVVFQFMLLAGYFYSDAIVHRLERRRGAALHLCVLLSVGMMVVYRLLAFGSAITPAQSWRSSHTHPVLLISTLLAITVGAPFFVLATTSPLLQAWHPRAGEGSSSYRLYALSNAGSLIGLMAYPFSIERLHLHTQALFWSLLFVLFVAGCSLVAISVVRAPNQADRAVMPAWSAVKPATSSAILWFLLAACASAELMATTNQICQNVAVMPLLWVLPLSIYLLSFILCFDSDRWYSRQFWSVCLGIGTVLVAVVFRHAEIRPLLLIGVYLFAMFACCMVCHGEAARSRPAAAHLTKFYLLIGAGGVTGSMFVLIVCPLIFTAYFWELHLAIIMAWVLLITVSMRDSNAWIRDSRPWLLLVMVIEVLALLLDKGGHKQVDSLFLCAIVITAAVYLFSQAGRGVVLQAREAATRGYLTIIPLALFMPVFLPSARSTTARNFYGILAVFQTDGSDDESKPAPMLALRNGRIVHGAQFIAPEMKALPTTYYGPTSGVGLALTALANRTSAMKVGAVGLGAGTVAAYGRSQDSYRFYELNPEDIRFAYSGPPLHFTFLKNSAAHIQVIEGDARIRLEEELQSGSPQAFDVLILDAFSGDAIPVHLLTQEAFTLYLRHLKPEGLIALHISNDAVDLGPVVAGLAERHEMQCVLFSGGKSGPGTSVTVWALLAKDGRALQKMQGGVPCLGVRHKAVYWTDEFNNIFDVLR